MASDVIDRLDHLVLTTADPDLNLIEIAELAN